MPVEIREEHQGALEAYGTVPMTLTVDRRLRIMGSPGGEKELVAERVVPPWTKDYDADAGPPTRLRERWDLTNWGVLSAFDGDRRVGGALIAWRTDGVDMLEGREDLAVLWDLRVQPGAQRQGVGSRLLRAALTWVRERGCTCLYVETQDINVPACRFYAHHGFRLLRAEHGAYPNLPGEVRLLFSRSPS